MNKFVRIGNMDVGDGLPCFFIAEIGINHNGCVKTAKKLIDLAVASGCSAVKFQKRTIDVVYTKEELAMPRTSPFGETNGDLKRGLEFSLQEYEEIDKYCKEKHIMWFASCWDEASVDFIDKFNPPCYKISSASLTDDNLLKHTRSKGKPILLSTGMSTLEEIDHAVKVCQRLRSSNRNIKILFLVRPEQENIRNKSVDAQNAGIINNFIFYDNSMNYLLAKLEAL